MEKLAYLILDEEERDGTELREALVAKAAPALREAGAREITVFAQDADTAAGQALRRDTLPIRAMVTFWLACEDDRGPCEDVLAAQGRGLVGYLVVESEPMIPERRAGERVEGMAQVTCITRKADLPLDEFVRIWHGDHRRVAIETQSTFGYVRNPIVRRLTEAGHDYAAIVVENFPLGALTDPKVFYDARDDEELQRNAGIMMKSVERFLDLQQMEFTHMSEYYLG